VKVTKCFFTFTRLWYPFVCVAITQAYFQIESGEDAQEEFGWKLVHGDVFRPPRKGMLLSVLLGSGVRFIRLNLRLLYSRLIEFKYFNKFNNCFFFYFKR